MSDTLSELIAQRDAVDRKIREAQTAERSEAIERVRQLMAAHSLTAAEISQKPSSKTIVRSTKKVAPKYRHPESGATWTGRGLKPKWLSAALDDGKTLTEFLI